MKCSNIKGECTHFSERKIAYGLVAEFSSREKTPFETSALGSENIFFSDSSQARPSRIRNYQFRSPEVESLPGGLGSRYEVTGISSIDLDALAKRST